MSGEIAGRERELEAIARSLASVPSGAHALLIGGPPGIGKSTVWRSGLAIAESLGYHVLVTRSAEAEAKLSYVGLGDLLADALDELDPLPEPQRRALDVALLREVPSRGVDRRAVSVATFGAIKRLAENGPVVLAVDDVQWIDDASASALSFALRRLGDEPIGVLGTLRQAPGLSDALDVEGAFGSRAERLMLAPIPMDALARIVRMSTGADLPRPTLVRVHEASGGNPLFALEIVRALRHEGRAPEPGEPLPAPDDLDALLRGRIRGVPERTREALLLASAARRPTSTLVRAASSRRGVDALGPAEEADIIRIERDLVSFTHPLLASIVYRSAASSRRRAAHRRLADVVDDPEERARHLALASSDSDPEVAAALEDAAGHANRRGAPGTAAELSELARRVTPSVDVEDMRRRAMKSAEYRFVAGDAGAALAITEELLSTSTPGLSRAEVRSLISEFCWNDVARLRPLLEAVLDEVEEPSSLGASAFADLAWVEILGGDLRSASSRARRAIELAEPLDDPGPLALGLVTAAYAGFMRGHDVSELLSRALALESEHEEPAPVAYSLVSARNTLGAQLMWSGDLDGGRRELELHARFLADRGQYLPMWEGLTYLSELESRAGHFERALAYAEELLETMTEGGYEQAKETGLWVRALAEAHLGLVENSRSDATAGLALAERHGDAFHVITNRSVLGFLELSLGHHEGANRWLEPLPDLLDSRGIVEPGVYPFVPDAVEVLVGLGLLDRADEVLGPFERQGVALGRSLALATSARCRGLIEAARGDLGRAIDVLESSMALHATLAQPFEVARFQLVLGEVRRRAKQKRATREALESALRIFDELGTPLWSARARRSLARISGRKAPHELTETERQVASLVVEGMTNREVAEALFVSVRTIESNLSRIYAKLGIRSRRELRAEVLERTRAG